MSYVTACVLIMGVLGALFGIGLALASRFFHVEIDPRVAEVASVLPGVNCGGCGYAGCDAYADAVVKGAAPNLCLPGGHAVAVKVAHAMGQTLDDEPHAVRAIVHCQGGTDRCASRFEYRGIPDCRAAHLVQGGFKRCEFGCLGLGTCVSACPFGAISMGPDRIPVVNWDRCTGCGACTRVCPRKLLETVPANAPRYVACSSQDMGKVVRETCSVGCISCWLCQKFSAPGAVEKNGNLPKLTYPAGEAYAKAAEKCPMHCFVTVTPPMVGARAEAPPAAALEPAAATA